MFRHRQVFQGEACNHSRRRNKHLCAAMCFLAATLIALSAYPETGVLAESKSRAPVTTSIKGLEISPQEFRIRVRALIRPTLGFIEERADQLIANTPDRFIRRGVLVLKIEMTSTMLIAMMRSDPVLAIADAWCYVIQVEDLIKRPDIRAKYGISSPRDPEAFAFIEGQFRDLVSSVQPGPFAEKLEAQVRKWAETYPIQGAIYRRPSMGSAVAKTLAKSEDGGVFSTIGGLEETTADLITGMDLYTIYLPRLHVGKPS